MRFIHAVPPIGITAKIVTAFVLVGCCLVSYMGSAVFSLVAEVGWGGGRKRLTSLMRTQGVRGPQREQLSRPGRDLDIPKL